VKYKMAELTVLIILSNPTPLSVRNDSDGH
jgi:hypothetical protein